MPSIADALEELNDKTMTRKEQIKEYLRIIGNGETMGIPFDVGFECGVEWADSHPHWISVDDELPPKESEYDALSNNVLATDGKEIYESVYNHDFGEWFTHDLWAIDNITHWMPLPAPPEHIADVSKKISSSVKPNNCKKFDMKGYENVVIHEGNAKGGILKTIDADKVIAWLVANICDYDYYVKLFKKDFGI